MATRRRAPSRRPASSGRRPAATGRRRPAARAAKPKRVTFHSPVRIHRKPKSRKITTAGLVATLIAGLITLITQILIWLVVTAVLTVITLVAWAVEGRDEPAWAELRRHRRRRGPLPVGSKPCRAKNRFDASCGNVTTNPEGFCWWHRHWRQGGAAA